MEAPKDHGFVHEEEVDNNVDANGEIEGGNDAQDDQDDQDDAPQRRTPYRRCPRAIMSIPAVPFRYWLAAASLIFLLLPGSSDLLYLGGSRYGRYGTSVLGGSCTSGNEWLWISSVSAAILVPYVANAPTSRSIPPKPRSRATRIRPRLTLPRLNCLWYAASVVGPFLWRRPTGVSSLLDWIERLGGKAAWPALLDLTVVLLPAQRLSRLLDFYYYGTAGGGGEGGVATRTALVGMHTDASWWAALWIALHTVLLTVVYLVRDYETFWEKMVPMTKYTTEGIVNFAGWVGAFMLLLLWVSARDTVRHRWYDFFILSHVVSGIGFVLGSNCHDYNTLMFAWPGLAEILIERLTRYFSCRESVEASAIEVRSFGSGVVGLTVDLPKSWTALPPGRHAYLRDETVSRNWHPVTISSVDREGGRISFHVKARGDWTDAFVAARTERDRDAPPGRLEIEGPYGPDLSVAFDGEEGASSCVFVAGGIGMTGLSEAVRACARRGVPFTVLWLVHTRAEADALGAEVLWNRGLFRSVATKNVPAAFRVFVTKEGGPNPDGGLDAFAQEDDGADHGRHHATDKVAEAQSGRGEAAATGRAKLSVRTVAIVVLASMALSFALARQLCCYGSDPDGTKTCGLAFDPDECRYCNMNDIRHLDEHPELLPCCKVDCYLCFRGLTVLSVLFLAPSLSAVLLCLLRRYLPASEAKSNCCLLLARRGKQRHYHSAVQEIITIQGEDGSISWAHVNPAGQEVHRPLALTYAPPTSSELVTVSYARPDVGEVLRSLWKEDESDENRTVSVVVCGPQRLADDVQREVKRQQSQDFVNQYKLIVM